LRISVVWYQLHYQIWVTWRHSKTRGSYY